MNSSCSQGPASSFVAVGDKESNQDRKDSKTGREPILITRKILDYNQTKTEFYRKLQNVCDGIYDYSNQRIFETPLIADLKKRLRNRKQVEDEEEEYQN